MKRNLLLYLAEKGGLFSEIKTSTKKIAKETKTSQQSVSRLLIDLEKEGKIARSASPEGVQIAFKQEGIDYLQKEYVLLKKILQPDKKLKGKLVRGFDEGKYYVDKYKSKIKEAVGFMPFAGTLNIKTNDAKVKSFLMDLEPIVIDGFNDGKRSYGSVKLYKIKINGINGAIIRPERTRHGLGVVEVITGDNLKKGKNLKEGGFVELQKY